MGDVITIGAGTRRADHWRSSESINRFLWGALEYLPGRRVNSTRELDSEIAHAVEDFKGTGQLREIQAALHVPRVDLTQVHEIGTQILDFSQSAKYKGLEEYVDAVLRHSEIKILPTRADPTILRPTLIIDRTYYQDMQLRNIDLLKLVSFLAKEFGFTDIYLPDISIEHIDENGAIRATGGYKAASFLDLSDNFENHKETIDLFLELYKEHSATMRRLFDYGKAQLFHNDKDTFMAVNLPTYEALEDLGISFRKESDYQKFKDELFKLFESKEKGKSSIILLDDYHDKDSLQIPRQSEHLGVDDPGKRALLDNLDGDTPEHIRNLLYKQNWFFDADNNTLVMLPIIDKGDQKAYDYCENGKLRLAEFFISNADISVRAYENSDLADPAINRLYFSL
jgi:hypothetical protein